MTSMNLCIKQSDKLILFIYLMSDDNYIKGNVYTQACMRING